MRHSMQVCHVGCLQVAETSRVPVVMGAVVGGGWRGTGWYQVLVMVQCSSAAAGCQHPCAPTPPSPTTSKPLV